MADARYFRVSPKFWSDPMVAGWDDDARLVAMYLLTCEHRNTEGLFRLPKLYAQADLGWTSERYGDAFGKLVADGFVAWDEKAQVVMIIKALAWQSPDNRNQAKAAGRRIAELPKNGLETLFVAQAKRYSEPLTEALPDGFGEPIPEPISEPTPDPRTRTQARSRPQLAPVKPARKPDLLFEAIVEACGLELAEMTTSARGATNRAAKELRQVGATPDDIRARARVHRKRWPDAECTPSSLAKNYAQLGTAAGKPTAVSRPDREVGTPEYEARIAAEREQREALAGAR